jgi:Alw26I/Eco31I/Esp3I family type II restriction endonuclease
MRLEYAYPNGYLKNRIEKQIDPNFDFDPLEEIGDLIQRLRDQYGEDILNGLPDLLETGAIDPPDLGQNLDRWLTWIEDSYIPREPTMLSPGAMSNAPDRFDGFHHFNRCCRGTADSGRHKENLRRYTTDRRVFEHWNGGDWVAADRMMGIVRSKFSDAPRADDQKGRTTADHIGPVSLGFVHRPEYRLLSSSANSAKNNRMTLSDVRYLRQIEDDGIQVASWYAQPLWDLRKYSVDTEEKALRMSKLLRDNQQNAMHLLYRILEGEHYTFLSTFLNLQHADYDVEFEGLHVDEEHYVTAYQSMEKSPRTTKYAAEQKARRLRVGIEALFEYAKKENRQAFLIENADVEKRILGALTALREAKDEVRDLDDVLHELFYSSSGRPDEGKVRQLTEKLPQNGSGPGEFEVAREELQKAMEEIGVVLSSMWDNDRYIRI